jgi:hypothetical protein
MSVFRSYMLVKKLAAVRKPGFSRSVVKIAGSRTKSFMSVVVGLLFPRAVLQVRIVQFVR